jgi:hypothetical protein
VMISRCIVMAGDERKLMGWAHLDGGSRVLD